MLHGRQVILKFFYVFFDIVRLIYLKVLVNFLDKACGDWWGFQMYFLMFLVFEKWVSPEVNYTITSSLLACTKSISGVKLH